MTIYDKLFFKRACPFQLQVQNLHILSFGREMEINVFYFRGLLVHDVSAGKYFKGSRSS